MATYKVHDEAVKHARKLIDAGTYDDTTDWSEAAPSPDDPNTEINKETFGDFARWHLGINPEGSEGTKGRYASRYGDFTKVDRAALIHAKQRASQNDHNEIAKARRQPPLSCRYCVLQNCLWTELALRPDHYFAVRVTFGSAGPCRRRLRPGGDQRAATRQGMSVFSSMW